MIITGAVLYLALSRRLLYERYHDWIMIFLRLASYPALILYSDSPCGVIKNVFGRSLIGSGLRDRLSGSVEYSLRALIDVQSCSADEEMPANWLLAVFGAVLAFGPIKLFIDGLRYPLRFRHHVFVQIGAIMVMCIWNKHVCDSCFSENASQVRRMIPKQKSMQEITQYLFYTYSISCPGVHSLHCDWCGLVQPFWILVACKCLMISFAS